MSNSKQKLYKNVCIQINDEMKPLYGSISNQINGGYLNLPQTGKQTQLLANTTVKITHTNGTHIYHKLVFYNNK